MKGKKNRKDLGINKTTEELITLIKKRQEIKVLKLLRKHECDINAKDKDGNTPLVIAMYSGQNRIVLEILEDKSLDINERNDKGNTVLMMAIKRKDNLLTRKILEIATIDIGIRDKKIALY